MIQRSLGARLKPCVSGLPDAGFCRLFGGANGSRSRFTVCALPFLLLLFLASGCSLHSGKPSEPGMVPGSSISRTALSTVGTRYTYGGANPSKGFDCSGLVCWAYSKNGVNMPRTAKEQSSVGKSVSKGGLKPGDLVVFKISSGLHTGIYTGKGNFVHSPSKGKTVREDSLDSDYWRSRFVAGRRHRQVY